MCRNIIRVGLDYFINEVFSVIKILIVYFCFSLIKSDFICVFFVFGVRKSFFKKYVSVV